MREIPEGDPNIRLYLKVYTEAGHYVQYGRTKEGGPDPRTRQQVNFEKGDTEGVYLTAHEVRQINQARGMAYMIVATPLQELLEGLKINTAGYVLEYVDQPGGPMFGVVRLGEQRPTEAGEEQANAG